jgi:excisionase family DNA binding protein
MSKFLTVSEAARRIGVTPTTVRALELAGKLPAQRTETGVRFFEAADVDRLVRKRQREADERQAAAREADEREAVQ